MGRVLKDIGLCTFSFLIKFIAFTANILARKNTTNALSTNGFNNLSDLNVRLCENENSMNQLEATWSFWGLHQRLCDGQTIYRA